MRPSIPIRVRADLYVKDDQDQDEVRPVTVECERTDKDEVRLYANAGDVELFTSLDGALALRDAIEQAVLERAAIVPYEATLHGERPGDKH